MAKRRAAKANSGAAVAEPTEDQKVLSVRIPAQRHKTLKAAAVDNSVSIRSIFLAVISEIEADSSIGRALLEAAADH